VNQSKIQVAPRPHLTDTCVPFAWRATKHPSYLNASFSTSHSCHQTRQL
jgi:hypothetical protein